MLISKTITLALRECVPNSPHLTRLNTYTHLVFALDGSAPLVSGPPITEGVTIIGLDWADDCRSQWCIGDNGLKYRPEKVLEWQ